MRKLQLLVLSTVLVLGVAMAAQADVPQLINYQGILLDSGGNPVTTPTNVFFSIWDDPLAGVAYWYEAHSVTPDANGSISVLLGSAGYPIPDTVFADPDRWLETRVESDPPMTPRMQIATVGYAFRVSTVDGSTGGIISGDVDIQSDLFVSGKATIGPGHTNTGGSAFVAGEGNSTTGNWSTVGGGINNTASGAVSTIGGGTTNQATLDWTVVGGGQQNQATAAGAVVVGGNSNIGSGDFTFVGGGAGNDASGVDAVVVGGLGNKAFGVSSAIGGGSWGIADGSNATVSGGSYNKARGQYSVVCGGGGVTEADSNAALGDYSAIGGGRQNTASGNYSTVSGGSSNMADNFCATVGGGVGDTASGYAATVAGGRYNTSIADYSAICGGLLNAVSGEYGTVSGGRYNKVTFSDATVGGGSQNHASNDYATVGGGYLNTANAVDATVSGGEQNVASAQAATVAGGDHGTASGRFATVPGGRNNLAAGNYSFAAGHRAKANNGGCFVWGDSTNADIAASVDNQWKARASGGVYFYTNSTLTSGSYIAAGGNSWNSISDRAGKSNFVPVNGQAILDKLAVMPINEYNIIGQDLSVRHIGPVAQDFFAAFSCGESDRAINMEDADGVALAAIKALHAKNQELEKQLAELQAQMQQLLAEQQ